MTPRAHLNGFATWLRGFARSFAQSFSVKVAISVIGAAVIFLTGQILAYQAQQKSLATKDEVQIEIKKAVQKAVEEALEKQSRDVIEPFRRQLGDHESYFRRGARDRDDIVRRLDFLVCAHGRPARLCPRP